MMQRTAADCNQKNLTDQDILDGALYLPVSFTAFNENPAMVQNRYWKKRLNN